MLSSEELRLVYERAYLPEHLPRYVEAVSCAEPYLYNDYLCFTRKNHLIFIGYPLGIEADKASKSYESACERFHPATVSVIASQLWFPDYTYEIQSRDSYYKLELPLGPLHSELSYMLRRAARELKVTEGTFGKAHRRIVKDFISGHKLSEEYKHIYERIPYYLKGSKAARLFEARKRDVLVAFTIVDLGSDKYAFYLFNFRSVEINVPGASDLLFFEMVDLAQSEGKEAINLGLGIHPGVRYFKEKWGGTPFLPYIHALLRRQPLEMGAMVDKL